MRIDAVPSKSLETIKDWLTSVKIKYYECKLNLAWKPILKSIQEDPEGFFQQGGWDFLNMEVRRLGELATMCLVSYPSATVQLQSLAAGVASPLCV
jgi:hypothetical protein